MKKAKAKKTSPKVGGICGIGVDLVQIARIERLLQRHGDRLLNKLLTAGEQRQVRARNNIPRALAMNWAAKEACVKAMGLGFDGIGFKDIALLRAGNGAPHLAFNAAQKKRLRQLGVGAAHVSLSDDGGMACAYVVLEKLAR